MKQTVTTGKALLQCLECYGQFDAADPICKKRCGVRLRCAVESRRQERLEILDDMLEAEDMFSFRPH
jgi:hypothetical protein